MLINKSKCDSVSFKDMKSNEGIYFIDDPDFRCINFITFKNPRGECVTLYHNDDTLEPISEEIWKQYKFCRRTDSYIQFSVKKN